MQELQYKRTGCNWLVQPCLILTVLVTTVSLAVAQSTDREQLIADASKRALKFIAPSVVRIQTLGGQEKVGDAIVATGPTTGLIVGEEGFIVSSAFNFKHNPTTILVTLPDGKNTPATIVGRDKSRMLVLLQVKTEESLPVPEAVSRNEISPGQFALAMGRTYDSELPSVSAGIISAVNRIWGKAIQTDCKVSPANYGGPLTDMRGRVMGVLVPLSAQDTSEMAGAEYYDGGIGFAIPMDDIQRMLPALKDGKTIFPGKMGVSMKGSDIYLAGPPEIAYCPVKSPAAEAGLKRGDRITHINDVEITSQAVMKHTLGPLIAGDEVSVSALRGDDDQKIDATFELTDKVEPYILPALGVLPEWQPDRESGAAARVRYVFPDSAADDAGLQLDDILISIDDKRPEDLDEWRERVALTELDQEISITYIRDGEESEVELKLKRASTSAPDDIPDNDEREDAKSEPGIKQLKLADQPNKCYVCLPADYNPDTPHGVVIWLPEPGKFDKELFPERWGDIAARFDLIIMAPQPKDKRRWKRGETEFVRKLFDKLAARYTIDPNRVVVHGTGVGGALGFACAFENRDIVRGIAPVNSVIPMGVSVRPNDPYDRLEILAFGQTEAKIHSRMKSSMEALEEAEFPTLVNWIEGEERKLNNKELEQLGRWSVSLKRL